MNTIIIITSLKSNPVRIWWKRLSQWRDVLKGPESSKAGSSSIWLQPRPHTFPICTDFTLAFNLSIIHFFPTCMYVKVWFRSFYLMLLVKLYIISALFSLFETSSINYRKVKLGFYQKQYFFRGKRYHSFTH